MSDSEEPSIVHKSKANNDLDSLLDSALDDFDKPLPELTPSIATAAGISSEEQIPILDESESNQWSKEFHEFQTAMQSILIEDPNFKAELDELTYGKNCASISRTLEDAMQALADGVQSADEPSSSSSSSSADMAQLIKNLGFTDGPNPQNASDFMPFMQNVMQNLLSKELLYPALKDIVSKYPDWLAENRPNLSPNMFENYSRQYDLMVQICEEYEMVHEPKSEASFEKILALMQKMQECGNPPKDLIGELSADVPFDEQGNFKGFGKSEQCAIM